MGVGTKKRNFMMGIKILILIGMVIAAAIVHAIVMHERVNDIEGRFNFIDLYTNTKIKNLASRIVKLEGIIEKKQDMKNDNVNSPAHYRQGGVECIEAIKTSMSEEGFKDYLKGNVIKYIWRYEHKGKAMEDIGKAIWYLNRLKDEL